MENNFVENPAESPVDNQAGKEHKILKFWESKKIFEKLKEKTSFDKCR